MKTPVAFLIFNRPQTAEKVFAEIAKAKPPVLLVVADGPRDSRPGEAELCGETRRIIEKVDWKCEVLKNYSDVNLGCRKRVSSGLDWVFDTVEEAIILEDDCLPDHSFFRFCEDLLEYYRDVERVMSISGTNWQFGRKIGDKDYFFSKYNLIWGWATWRRAWRSYDVDMKTFPDFVEQNQIGNVLRSKDEQVYYMKRFTGVYESMIDTWDYQWLYATLVSGGISVHPNVNLIENIGFGDDATHTVNIDPRKKNNKAQEIGFPLRHPVFVLPDEESDQYLFREVICPNIFNLRVENMMKKYLADSSIEYLKKIKKQVPFVK